MTIANELTKLNTNLTNSYTAVSSKGGTLPSAQNFDNLATAIDSIPSGGGGGSKYGATVDTVLGDVNANGVLQKPTEQSDLVFTGVKDVVNSGLYYIFAYSGVKSVSFPNLTTISGYGGLSYAFLGCTGLTNVDLSSLTTVSGNNGLSFAFDGCTGLTNVDLSSLTTISGYGGLNYAFRNCRGLTSIDLSSLTTISGGNSLAYAFDGCTGLTSINLSSLTTVSGSYGLYNAFRKCTGLTDVYFNALTTASFGSSNVSQFNNMMASTGTTVTHTLHFPSNLQSKISTLTGYPLFGGTSGYVVCAFDLNPTE